MQWVGLRTFRRCPQRHLLYRRSTPREMKVGDGMKRWNGVADSGTRRHLGEAFGGNDGCEGDHGVVAKMEKETGDDGAGAGARKRENDTDESEKRHEAPGPAELSTVHQAKEEPRDENSGKDTKGFGEKRIEVAAENGLFD